ncbi:MAG: tryptophan synthase subunit alpha [Thermaerobacter sp.]|nr:tryptophan synthase subunit alpha [Thermaerobacter sp.]
MPNAGGGRAAVRRLEAVFRGRQRAALMPYLTAGFPDLDSLPALLAALAVGGADAVELGIPFSDPLADGPALQAAATAALTAGFTLDGLWDVLERTLPSFPLPVVLLTYVNPILAHGTLRFVERAVACGVTGLIVPDLPWVESGPLRRLTRDRGLALVPMATPNSPERHLQRIRSGEGFVYGVSVTGVTGVRDQLAPDVLAFASRLKEAVRLPVAIGFGISTPEQAARVGTVADGVIVGSALVSAMMQDPVHAAGVATATVRALHAALDKQEGRGPE